MDNTKKLTPKDARIALWHKGILSYKLHKAQQEIYDFVEQSKDKTVVISSSRRLGKSFLLCLYAIEQCLKKDNVVVKYVAPQQQMIKTILRPIMREVLKDCPPELRPDYKTNDKLYRFPNGSEIQLAGTDSGHAESLRGGSSDLCIVDEAGFCSDLQYIVQSILIPTTTTTEGKIILSSTPPKTPDHEFVAFIREAEHKGTLMKKVIYDNPLITPTQINDIIRAFEHVGGINSVEFRREYLCEIIVDQDEAIVPEFNDALQKEIISDWKRPPRFDVYTAMDLGFKDLTVVLFAYYDFRNSKLIIEDELVMKGVKMTTDVLASSIKNKEATLWVNKLTNDIQKPLLRISDNNLIVLNDLQRLHNLSFMPTSKDHKDAALNNMRMYLAQRKVVINPRCRTLILHLKNGTWNKARTTYDRSVDAGHYDAIDALMYLVRNVNWAKNPYPAGFDFVKDDTLFDYNQSLKEDTIHKSFKDMFTVKKIR